jgi:CheY-like chemotaxis protein
MGPVNSRRDCAAQGARAGEAGAPATARALRILVIEDNVDAAETLKDVLELSDHQVAVALAGPVGLEKARRFRPDVVLCDIGLPGMDGYAVARAFREDPALRRVGLVALTGYAMTQDRERAQMAGFDWHLPKPPDLLALERIISELAGTADTPLPESTCPGSAASRTPIPKPTRAIET